VGATPEAREAVLAAVRDGTLDPAGVLATAAPQEATDASAVRWWRLFFQLAISPVEASEELRSLDPGLTIALLT